MGAASTSLPLLGKTSGVAACPTNLSLPTASGVMAGLGGLGVASDWKDEQQRAQERLEAYNKAKADKAKQVSVESEDGLNMLG